MSRSRSRMVMAGLALLCGASSAVEAQAVRTNAGFTTNSLARNDDGSTGLVDLGFLVNFYGVSRTQTYVNNNGNITFDNPLSTFTPFPLLATSRQIIAPFFADIDTRTPSPGLTQYGQDVVDGRAAFGVNWLDVGYFSAKADKLNAFQLVLLDRSDIAAGDFDFEFNVNSIQFEAGGASGDNAPNDGLCNAATEPSCVPARVGYSNGSSNSVELPGSGVNGAFINGGPNALASNSLNSNVTGRYLFNVRGGQVQQVPGTTVPEPSTVFLVATGMLGVTAAARRRRGQA